MFENDELDEALDRELRALGPVMRKQQQAEAQGPDPEFVSSLRARLVGDAPAEETPSPRPARPRPEPIPFYRRLRMRHAFGGGLAAAAIAAAVVALVLNSRNAESPGSTKPVAIGVPKPNPTELTRSFPMYGLGGGGNTPEPWQTDLDYSGSGGPPFTGHLSLSADPLPV